MINQSLKNKLQLSIKGSISVKMESSELINKKGIWSLLTSKISKETLNSYVSYISKEICTKENNQSNIDLQTFSSYFSYPLLISENLFNLSKKRKEERTISLNLFSEVFNQIKIFSLSENEIDKKIDFMLNFFIKMSDVPDKIYINDIFLLCYHFHMKTNKSKKNFSYIDEIISDFSSGHTKTLSSCDFIRRIKEKSDLFYLFFFYFNFFLPFEEDEIEFLIQEANRAKNDPVSDLFSESLPLSAPSAQLFMYLNKEFNVDLVYYTEADCELSELDDFMNDIVNTKTQKNIFHKYSFIDTNTVITKNNILIRNTKRIFPLSNSFIDDSNTNVMIYLCNENLPSIEIYFDNENCRSNFIEKYKKYQNIQKFEDKYEILKEISSGEYGTCYISKLKSQKNKIFFVKMLIKSKNPNYHWELSINQLLNKSNIEGTVKCVDIFETVDKIYLVNEYLENGSLNDYLFDSEELLTSEIISKILTNILKVLNTLNKVGIIHRDIKPDNILITKNLDIKLIDFGFSKIIATNQLCNENCGTVSYASPELITKQFYSKKTDFWSIGVIAYYLQFGSLPFDDEGDDCTVISEKIISIEYDLPNPKEIENYCPMAYELIVNFLKFEKERPELSKYVKKCSIIPTIS